MSLVTPVYDKSKCYVKKVNSSFSLLLVCTQTQALDQLRSTNLPPPLLGLCRSVGWSDCLIFDTDGFTLAINGATLLLLAVAAVS